MNYTLRGASGVALAAGLAAFTMPAWAQQALDVVHTAGPQEGAAPAEQVVETPAAVAPAPIAAAERIVVTGSLVGGESEDAPSPVEVFDLEALQEQGAPTAAEFLRTLSISSEAQGEADSQLAGAASGFANVNLRGLGASRTMVLLNGRRFASTNGGAGADINTLPMMAIGRIDVLKDGASVTYGAGAVGGVINYITRKNFSGFEVSAEKKYFDGSDGEENIEALWGIDGDSSNLLLAASYGKRHELSYTQRDYSNLPFAQQPAGYTIFGSNPSNYYTFSPLAIPVTTGNTGITGNYRDYTPDTCRAIGGEITNVLNPAISPTASNALDCAVPLQQYFNHIDEEEYLRGYLEYNSDLSDTMEFHFEASYAKTTNPNIKTGASLPSGNNRATQTLFASQIGGFQVPYSVQTYNEAGAVVAGGAVINPYAAEFFNRNAPAATRQTLYTSNQWRPVMFGGNPLFADNIRRERQERERFGAAVSLSGDFTEDGLFGRFLPEGTTFDYGATYSKYTNEASRPDWLVARLQNALRGYGGPNCEAIDRVATVAPRVPQRAEFAAGAAGTLAYQQALAAATTAYDATVGIQSDTAAGTNGCQFFNPFASSFASSYVNGAANPSYGGAGFENSASLIDWMTHRRTFETINEALTFDAVYGGEVPFFELPGGPISWALGSQWRQTETRGVPGGDEETVDFAGRDCPWGDLGLAPNLAGQGACAAQSGPYFGSGIGRQFAYKTDTQTISYFGELQIPVLDNLNFQVAARREEFGEIKGDIWKVAGKYDPLDWLSFRASYSTNFQAPPDDLEALGVQNGSVYVSSLFRGVPTTITTLPGITPEDDHAINVGIIVAPELFGGQLRASADFFEIGIDGEVGNTSLSQVLTNVFGTSTPSVTTAANCGASFVSFITFIEGSCTTGASTAGSITNIAQYTLNTGGFITNGIDYNVDWTRDVGPGTLRLAFTATQNLVYKVKGYSVPGIGPGGSDVLYTSDIDGLGFANLNNAGTIMPEWRGNASAGYSLDNHRFLLRANFISAFVDQTLTPAQSGVWGYRNDDYVDYDFNYLFDAPFWEDLQLRLSVLNITDEDPMAAQNTNAGGLASASRTGYYPGYGNVRGRQFEFGITKTF